MAGVPVPRVRDEQGRTWELYWFLRKTYRKWVCPSWRTGRESCACEDCLIDNTLNEPWEKPTNLVHPAKRRYGPAILGVNGSIDGNRWVGGPQ